MVTKNNYFWIKFRGIILLGILFISVAFVFAQQNTPSPTPTSSPPSNSPIPSPTETPQPSPSLSPTPYPLPNPTASPPLPSPTTKPSPTPYPLPNPTASPSLTPKPTPSVSPTPYPLPRPVSPKSIKVSSECLDPFIRGDANQDGRIDISDAVYLGYALEGVYTLACEDAADVNNNEVINHGDYEHLLQYLFKGGAPPQAPFPLPGVDEACDTEDNDGDGRVDEGCPRRGIVKNVCASFIRGDANQDGKVDISDSVFIRMYLAGDIELKCRDAADVNNNEIVDEEDSNFILMFMFKGGAPPQAPFPLPGVDEACDTEDNDGDGRVDEGCENGGEVAGCTAFIRGDVNDDGKVDISDSIYLAYALQGRYSVRCLPAADVNSDGKISEADYRYILAYLFEGGSPPRMPFPVFGPAMPEEIGKEFPVVKTGKELPPLPSPTAVPSPSLKPANKGFFGRILGFFKRIF